MKNIVLCGFMGTGKTVVGRCLAREMSMAFVDLDAVIEKDAGLAVRDIFEKFGEPRFRELEKEAIKRIVSGEMGDGNVVATGGGAVVDPSNRELLKKWAPLVCLTASVETILQRTDRGEKRPLLAAVDRAVEVRRLLRQRAFAYRDCDMTLDTTWDSVSDVVRKIKIFMNHADK